jgi:hypothetical protein
MFSVQNTHGLQPNLDFDVYCSQPNMVYNQMFILTFTVYNSHGLQQSVHYDAVCLQQTWSTTKCWFWRLLFTTNMVNNQKLIPIIYLISFGIIVHLFTMVDWLFPIISLISFCIIIHPFTIVDLLCPNITYFISFGIICRQVMIVDLLFHIICLISSGIYIYHFSSSYGREFIVLISYICLISFGIYIFISCSQPTVHFDIYCLRQTWSTTMCSILGLPKIWFWCL